MTVDHVEPIVRPLVCRDGVISARDVQGMPEQESLFNKLPACRSCNSTVRAMIRFGLLELKRRPVVFWFERMGRD